jgi:hypothetical protein
VLTRENTAACSARGREDASATGGLDLVLEAARAYLLLLFAATDASFW